MKRISKWSLILGAVGIGFKLASLPKGYFKHKTVAAKQTIEELNNTKASYQNFLNQLPLLTKTIAEVNRTIDQATFKIDPHVTKINEEIDKIKRQF